MQTITVTKNMVFLMETETTLAPREQEHILEEWKKIFPDNPLIIAKRGTLSLIAKPE